MTLWQREFGNGYIEIQSTVSHTPISTHYEISTHYFHYELFEPQELMIALLHFLSILIERIPFKAVVEMDEPYAHIGHDAVLCLL